MKLFQSLCPLALRSTIPLRIIRPSQPGLRSISRITGKMTSQRDDSIPHELRTAAEPRQNRLHPVQLSHIEQVNPSVRLLQFALPPQENNVWFSFFFIYCLFRYIPISRVLYIKLGCHARSWLFSPRRWIYMPRTQNFQSHLGICYHTLSPKRRH